MSAPKRRICRVLHIPGVGEVYWAKLMRISKVVLFEKSRTCPTSESLLIFSRDPAQLAASERIQNHLAGCDFCWAEHQLLAKELLQCEVEFVPVDIPKDLKLLAESVLRNPCKSVSSLAGIGISVRAN
jgi:hypothetical protein